MRKILFVCNQGRYRSRTAQDMFSDSFETGSAGIASDDNPLTKEKLESADIIVVMEDHQRAFIAEQFPKLYLRKKIISLNIPDIYAYDDKDLKKMLKKKLSDQLDG